MASLAIRGMADESNNDLMNLTSNPLIAQSRSFVHFWSDAACVLDRTKAFTLSRFRWEFTTSLILVTDSRISSRLLDEGQAISSDETTCIACVLTAESVQDAV